MANVFTGGDKIIANLKKIASDQPRKAKAAVMAEGKIEMEEAQKNTPRLSGDLIDSYDLELVEEGNVYSAKITVGEGLDYAIRQHEDLELDHPNGGGPKFLERTVKESAPYMGQRLAKRMGLGQ